MAKNFTSQLGAFMESEKAAGPVKKEQPKAKAPAKATKQTGKQNADPADKALKEIQKIDPAIKSIADLPADVVKAIESNQPITFKAVTEPKSKRLNLLIRPSLYHSLQAKAKEQGTSVNNLINDILQGAL